MNKLRLIFTGFALAALLLLPAIPALADDASANLIANSGVESSASGQPDNWVPESWGTNTTSFDYVNTGHSGSHAIQTTVSNYTDGDAKWIFNPVSVAASTQYTYSDWYEATTTTHVWAQYKNVDGSFSYQWLGSVGASNIWAQATEKLTVPDGVTAVSIFHVLNANGQLTIDDASLSAAAVCSVSQSNGVYDGGFEQTCPGSPNAPANWQQETYGDPSASFGYISSSRSGDYAVSTTVTNSGGEAGWQTDWQSAASNQRYGLTFWHDSTTYVYAYVAVKLDDGSLQYMGLMSVPATQNTGWSQYSDNFVTPANTAAVQITIATSGVGTFKLDDVYLSTMANQDPADFAQGVVSVTLDDGDASTYKNGFPVLKNTGIKSTFYINAGALGTSGYMTKSNVKSLASNGQEIGSHLYQHLDIVSLTSGELQQQISQNNNSLHAILGSSYEISDFASPYGSYTSSTLDTAMQFYDSHRTTDGQFNTKANLNGRAIHAILVKSTTTPDQVEAWVRQAKQQHQWLVLVYHAIGKSPAGGDGDGYATTPANFKTEMNYLKSSGVSAMTVKNALHDLNP